ncbi:AAA family ATPase [Paenibacillus sp. J22TS3]|uniref:AAA family ATPase n=1 Tax=Paenibacillus sp. J22TS3 TaxID=2807192 RepID=UPI001BCCF0BA|nr:AAA family ATPase [Paenibacillus sp. J22TS3]
MKKLILKKITLLSLLEKKARQIQFHPKITIIQGDNHTGKSSLLKSIYWTFGAEAAHTHPKWQGADVISVVNFTINEEEYSILRKKDFFAVFDKNENLLGNFTKITDGLAPYLGDLLNYRIKLNNRQNTLVTPPPAYFFLPFYIDQDVSWKENWAAFTNLSQLSNWRNNIVNYHTGIKPNEYYLINAKIENISKDIDVLDDKRKVSKNVLSKLIEQFNELIIDIDLEAFKEEINEMLQQYKSLKDKGDILRKNIVDLNNHKIHIQTQIDIVNKALKELRLDYDFAMEQLDTVDCPTCGHTYENSFAERFAIAKDEDRCQELLIKMQEDLREIDEKVNKEYAIYNENSAEATRIKDLLDRKQGEVKLKDLIQNEGKKELKTILQGEIDEITGQINSLDTEIKSLKEDLKTYEDKKRQKTIKERYLQNMHYYLNKLEVHTMQEKSYKSITSKIKETGSGLPRALLAYCFSILNVMSMYSTSTFCPIIIDSPNQQDQDPENLSKMIKIILQEPPANSQIILGLVELGDVQFEGDIIELTERYSLLNKDNYEQMSAYVRNLYDKGLEK